MQVALGRKGDYSVRALIDLARHDGRGRRKAREIAAEMEIPARYLPQILANLVRHGFLTAVAGPDGGYSLARDPAEVTLLEVVEAAEGPIRLEECVFRGGPCDWEETCPVHAAWSRAQGALIDELRATSLAELGSADEALEAGKYELPAEAPPHAMRRPRGGMRTK